MPGTRPPTVGITPVAAFLRTPAALEVTVRQRAWNAILSKSQWFWIASIWLGFALFDATQTVFVMPPLAACTTLLEFALFHHSARGLVAVGMRNAARSAPRSTTPIVSYAGWHISTWTIIKQVATGL